MTLTRSLVVGLFCAIAGGGLCAEVVTSETKNLCTNGRFEHLQEAAANPLPQGWSAVRAGSSARIEMADGSTSGLRALRLSANQNDTVGMNSDPMSAARGIVRFRYWAMGSSVGGANLGLFVIGLSEQSGKEVVRKGFSPPAEQVGDGKWHDGAIEFDFGKEQATKFLVAPRINENAPHPGDGEWLIENVEAYSRNLGEKLSVAYQWCDKLLARTGEKVKFSAFIENIGDEVAAESTAELNVHPALADVKPQRVAKLVPGSYQRVDWELVAREEGAMQVQASVQSQVTSATGTQYKILVIDKNSQYTRQELCTDDAGFWHLLPKPSTLQVDSSAPLTAIRHKKSSEIKRSTFGICAQLPRSKDYEDPFNPVHLVDDSPQTCWSSQQRPSPYPGNAPWAEIDLGREVQVARVNLVPYWNNSDFPIGFRILVSQDGNTWKKSTDVTNHKFDPGSEKRGDKAVQQIRLSETVPAHKVRIEFTRLPLSNGNYAEVSQGYKARLSGIEVIDSEGRNVALVRDGAKITASDNFTGWQNTARTVRESFDRIFDIGLKWVRVGQWGDQTEWAAVEREKGKFSIDDATDKAIQNLCDNGVDILFGLQYGNALYERADKPHIDIGPIYTEGHPFYLNGGPRTEDGRQAFLRYVDFVVGKYKDRIRWWELWNEQNGWYPGHEPELYGKLLNAVARRIKEIDPGLKVMFGGTAAPAPVTTEISLRDGAAPFIDATAFHPYGIDMPEGGMGTMEFHAGKNVSQSREQTGWNKLEEVLAGVKKPFAQHGNPNVQVWLNEWGTNITGLKHTYNPRIGEYGCAKYLMRFYVYGGWLKSPAAWWGLYNENYSQDWGIIDQEGYGFRPMSYALQNVCSVVSDAEPILSLDCKLEGAAPNPMFTAWRRDNSNETLVLAWAGEMNTDSVRTYPSVISFPVAVRPTRVTSIDLYWGLSQSVKWSYENGRVVIPGFIAHDYPVAVSVE